MNEADLFETVSRNEYNRRLAGVTHQQVWIIEYAENQLLRHSLTDWRFEISKHKIFLGRCYHWKMLIVFSSYYTHIEPEEIKDTILHEIAHALVGPNHGHDDVWKAECVKIGARPERLAPPDIQSSAKYNYYMECPTCGRKWYRHRMRQQNFGSRCPDDGATVIIYKLS